MKNFKNYTIEEAIKLINTNNELKNFYNEVKAEYENGTMDYSEKNCNFHCDADNPKIVVIDYIDNEDVIHQRLVSNLEQAIIDIYQITSESEI